MQDVPAAVERGGHLYDADLSPELSQVDGQLGSHESAAQDGYAFPGQEVSA